MDRLDIELMVDRFDSIRPFNRVLGLTRESMDAENACVRFDMREELLGNSVFGTLHGGVISSIMDIAGGFIVFLHLFKDLKTQPLEKAMERLTRVATIDIRVDYLRPGVGKHFVASGHILRIGNKVAVVRTELHNDQQNLIAVGTSTYSVG